MHHFVSAVPQTTAALYHLDTQEPQFALPLLNDFHRLHEVRASWSESGTTRHLLHVNIESAVPWHFGLHQLENDAALSDELARSVPQESDSQDIARVQAQGRELYERQRARRPEMAAERLEAESATMARTSCAARGRLCRLCRQLSVGRLASCRLVRKE